MGRMAGILAAILAVMLLAATAGLASGGQKAKATGEEKAAAAKSKQAAKSAAPTQAQSGSQAAAQATAQEKAAKSQGKVNGAGKAGNSGSGKAGGAAKVQSEHEPPGCNGTIHISDGAIAGNGTQPKYTTGQTVHVHGRGFDEAEVFLWWDVKKVNSGHALIDSGGGWTADGGGSFTLETVDTTQTPGHEYQVRVYWEEQLPNGDSKVCHKSKNFFTFGEEEQGGGPSNEEEEEQEEEEQEEEQQEEEQEGAGGAGGVSAGGGGAGEVSAGGGVLGAVAQGELPFTGLPLWIPLLASAVLVAGGLLLRRRAQGSEL